MAIIDISVSVRPGMVVWEGDIDPVCERVSSIEHGDGYNLSRLVMSAHTGTHVDAPLHFIDGAGAADGLSLEAMVGPVLVVDARTVEHEIDAGLVERELVGERERVIFATRNSALWDKGAFTEEFVKISAQAASLLIERGVRLVGIDYLSIGSPEAHRILLEAGVVLLEGLDLRGVRAGAYELVCLPLRLAASDGAPARAVLIDG